MFLKKKENRRKNEDLEYYEREETKNGDNVEHERMMEQDIRKARRG